VRRASALDSAKSSAITTLAARPPESLFIG
jgi:hypothetical protein